MRKVAVQEEIPIAPICDFHNKCLTPKAELIFSEWYDKYSDPKIGKMTPESATKFILGATNEVCDADDSRITGLFKGYAKKDPTGAVMEREEFFTFYYTAAKDKIERVHDNLRNHFVRTDLKKISDVLEETAFTKEEMPRFTISANQAQFNKLMDLLNRNDETSPGVWRLIRMLSTNQESY